MVRCQASLARGFVVARFGVVVEAVIGPFVNVSRVIDVVSLQRLLLRRPAAGDACVERRSEAARRTRNRSHILRTVRGTVQSTNAGFIVFRRVVGDAGEPQVASSASCSPTVVDGRRHSRRVAEPVRPQPAIAVPAASSARLTAPTVVAVPTGSGMGVHRRFMISRPSATE